MGDATTNKIVYLYSLSAKGSKASKNIKVASVSAAEVCLLNNSSCLAEALSVTKYVTVIGVKNFSRFARLIATMYHKGKRQFKPKGPIG